MGKTVDQKLADAPRIDHSLLSPNGTISGRARSLAIERSFGGENKITLKDIREEHLARIQPSKIEALERDARRCREYAAAGLRVRANLKTAMSIEQEIKELMQAQND